MQLYCPFNKKENDPLDQKHIHSVKFKELIQLKIKRENDIFVCEICDKKLGHQKIVALRVCGHVMCQKCCKEFVFDNTPKSGSKSSLDVGTCPSCGKGVRSKTKGII